MPPAVSIVLATLACVSSRRTVERTFEAEGLATLRLDLPAGDLEVTGADTPQVELTAAVRARAGSADEADARADQATVEAHVDGDALLVTASAPPHTRVDLTLTLPADLDLDLALADGDAELRGTRGHQVVAARGVRGRDLHGSVDVQASAGGADLELFPDGASSVLARGSLVVSLPYGLDYDLVVHPDPDWGADVTDLGFRDLVDTDTLVEGRAGSATLHVDLRALGGEVVVLEATPQP